MRASRATDRCQWQEVSDRYVAASERRIAGRVLAHCSRDLGLGDVRLRWVFARWWGVTGVRGFVDPDAPGCIFVTSGQPAGMLQRTVAHEARHVWQARQHRSWLRWWDESGTPLDRAAQEEDANAYAARVARELGW